MEQNLILAAILFLGLLGKNSAVAFSACFLLLLRIMNLERFFPHLEQYGVKIGIIVLTVGVLTPLASGRINMGIVWDTARSFTGVLAILIGMLVAYLGGKGVGLLTVHPQVITGLVVGTVIGVAFLKGVPVGPLIGAGLLSFYYTLGK